MEKLVLVDVTLLILVLGCDGIWVVENNTWSFKPLTSNALENSSLLLLRRLFPNASLPSPVTIVPDFPNPASLSDEQANAIAVRSSPNLNTLAPFIWPNLSVPTFPTLQPLNFGAQEFPGVSFPNLSFPTLNILQPRTFPEDLDFFGWVNLPETPSLPVFSWPTSNNEESDTFNGENVDFFGWLTVPSNPQIIPVNQSSPDNRSAIVWPALDMVTFDRERDFFGWDVPVSPEVANLGGNVAGPLPALVLPALNSSLNVFVQDPDFFGWESFRVSPRTLDFNLSDVQPLPTLAPISWTEFLQNLTEVFGRSVLNSTVKVLSVNNSMNNVTMG